MAVNTEQSTSQCRPIINPEKRLRQAGKLPIQTCLWTSTAHRRGLGHGAETPELAWLAAVWGWWCGQGTRNHTKGAQQTAARYVRRTTVLLWMVTGDRSAASPHPRKHTQHMTYVAVCGLPHRTQYHTLARFLTADCGAAVI